MKKLKYMLLILLCIFGLSGCNSLKYERDSSAGELVTVTLNELCDKVNNKETFSVVLTQSMCGYCQEFKDILLDYQKNHHLIMYEVILDYEDATPQENLAIIKPYFPEFSTTPGIFYVEKGKTRGHLTEKNGTIDKENLDSWVREFKLDKKK